MNRFVRIPHAAALTFALVIGCGGSDRPSETAPASTEPPAGEASAPAEPAPPAETAPPASDPAGGAGLEEQLAQGDKVWGDSCSVCHGDSGEGKGKKNPAVVGGKALGKYKNGGELLAYVKEKMPKDDPGSLSEAEYLAATAWMLSKNGKLDGTTAALTAESAAAVQLR